MTLERWVIPKQWCWTRAADVARIVGGGTPPSKDPENFTAKGIPWIGPADLTNLKGIYIQRGRRDLSQKGYSASGATLMPAGTVLFSSRAPIGYCAIASQPVSTNQGFKSWICEGGIRPEYVRYYLRSSVEYAENLASGTTFKEISGSRVEAMAFPLPPLAEQARIVAKLDDLTARIAHVRAELKRACHLATAMRTTSVEDAFAQRPFAATAHRLLGDSITIQDLVDEGPSNGWSPPSGADATGALTLKLTATTSGRLRLDSAAVKRIYDTPSDMSKFWLQTGDILIQRANALEHVGATAIYEGPPKTYIYPDLMMRIRVSNPNLARLLWYYFNSSCVRTQFRDNATGTAGNMPKISGAIVKSLTFPKLSELERDLMLEHLDAAFARADRLEAEAAHAIALLDRLEASVLAEAFRGELVPQDPADEPASALLDRIRTERASSRKPKRERCAVAAQ